ncbi:hypothetical protein [Hyalangium minutum]|uniref:Lipoprotein n=1 Tax=Hyalangium minutum TaxID=394096 RepID=A0A085W533_9BACT|nr:hypothetical protein [Hyalangium minutum]KFE62796.1 hypothetical protein DB31_3910 [Hyalangium minutum]
MKPSSKRMLLPALAASAVLCACGGVKVRYVDESRLPEPKPADCQLDIFVKNPPDRAHEVYGEISYKQAVKTMVGGASTNSGSRREAIEALRPKACELGADALLFTEEDHDRVNVTASLITYTGQ